MWLDCWFHFSKHSWLLAHDMILIGWRARQEHGKDSEFRYGFEVRSVRMKIPNSAMTFISADLKLELCQKLHFIPWAHFDQVIRNDLLVLFMCFWDVWLDQIGISSHWDFLLFFRKCQTYLGASQASAGFLRILIRIRIGFEFRDCFTFSVGRKKMFMLASRTRNIVREFARRAIAKFSKMLFPSIKISFWYEIFFLRSQIETLSPFFPEFEFQSSDSSRRLVKDKHRFFTPTYVKITPFHAICRPLVGVYLLVSWVNKKFNSEIRFQKTFADRH